MPFLFAAAALSGAASAQFLPKDDSFRAEVGLYIPTYSDGSTNLGVGVGLGWSFYRKNGFDVAAVARGAFFHGSIFGQGYDSSLGTYGVDLRYRPGKGRFFVGGGLAAASIDLDFDGFSGNTTKLGYSAEVGYDITKALYGVVRYQATTDDIQPYRGLTVGVGYRF